jgi:diguanylate cyclase (GGDEF)-like protein
VYEAALVFLALAALFGLAYSLRVRADAQGLQRTVQMVRQRESQVLEAARVFSAASRESTRAVLTALEGALRTMEPSLDAVLVFVPSGEDLACIYAGGARTEHFEGLRVRRDRAVTLPARAALCGHRVELAGEAGALIPTDRSALAVPMLGAEGLTAVVYAASACECIADPDGVVRAIVQAASPYALAADREADRAHATFDGLTGLFTPRAFRQKLQEEVAAARLNANASLALWFIDTDRFKHVNDTLGHGTGDAVLQQMARILEQHTVRGVDLPARNGGDEFCAIVRNAHKVAAIERAQRFCAAVRNADFGVPVRITASVGVSAYPYDATDASELLELADAAMYHSKHAGRDRVSFAVARGSFTVYS